VRAESIERALRIAFSYREKTIAAREAATRRHKDGQLSVEDHNARQEALAIHQARADARIAALQADARTLRESLAEERERVESRQRRLSQLAMNGRITPRRANALSRRLQPQLREARAREQAAVRAADATSSADLGGLVDMPLESYVGAVRRSALAVSGFDRITPRLLPIVLAASVVLPWLHIEGQSASLFGIGGLFADAGLASQPPGWGFRLLWLIYVALALAAWPLGRPMALRSAGRGMIALGLVLAWAAAMPLVAILARAEAGILPADVLLAPRAGMVLYCAGGLTYVFLGSRRLRLAQGPLRSSVRGVIILVATAVVIMAVGLLILIAGTRSGGVTFTADTSDMADGIVRLTIANQAPRPVSLYLPWPEGGPDGDDDAPDWGVKTYARERGAEEFRLFADSHPAWRIEDEPLQSGNRFSLGPDETVHAVLRLHAFADMGFTFEALRLVAVSPERELAIAEVPISPAPPVAAVVEPRRPAQGPPPRMPGAAGPTDEVTAPMEPAPESRGPRLQLQGIVGQRAGVRVDAGPDEPARNRLVAVGDELLGRWEVLSIETDPPEVRLRDALSGRELVLSPDAPEAVATP
jgi:hypothetical protein